MDKVPLIWVYLFSLIQIFQTFPSSFFCIIGNSTCCIALDTYRSKILNLQTLMFIIHLPCQTKYLNTQNSHLRNIKNHLKTLETCFFVYFLNFILPSYSSLFFKSKQFFYIHQQQQQQQQQQKQQTYTGKVNESYGYYTRPFEAISAESSTRLNVLTDGDLDTCADIHPDDKGNSWVLFEMGTRLVDLTHVFIKSDNRLLDVYNGMKGDGNDPQCIDNNTFDSTVSPQNGTVECDTPSTTFNGRISYVVTSASLNQTINLCEVEFYGQR